MSLADFQVSLECAASVLEQQARTHSFARCGLIGSCTTNRVRSFSLPGWVACDAPSQPQGRPVDASAVSIASAAGASRREVF